MDHKIPPALASFVIGNPNSELSFTQRLARENGWSERYANRAIHEYKKFMYLCSISGQSMTPSDQIDQVWHLHLLYSQNYWVDFCQKTLGKTIDHNPTKGGEDERNKFVKWYEDTIDCYEETFGSKPPKAIWPPAKIRFSKDVNSVRIHRARRCALPWWFFKLSWLYVVLGVILSITGYSELGSLSIGAIPVLILGHLFSLGRINFSGTKRSHGGGCGCSTGCTGCGGGCGD